MGENGRENSSVYHCKPPTRTKSASRWRPLEVATGDCVRSNDAPDNKYHGSAPWTLLSFPTPCTKVDYSLTPPSGTQSTILCGQGGTDPFKYLIKSSKPGAFVMTESAFCLGYQRAPWWRKFYPAWLQNQTNEWLQWSRRCALSDVVQCETA